MKKFNAKKVLYCFQHSLTKVGILGGLVGLIPSEPVVAKQVLVKLRSPDSFYKVENDLNNYRAELQSQTDFFSVTPQSLSHKAPRFVSQDVVVSDTLDQFNMLVVNVEDEQALRVLENNPEVEYLSPDFYYPIPMPPLNGSANRLRRKKADPNSPEITWGLKAVKALDAWTELEKGAVRTPPKILVTVLDTGIDRDHPDLKNQFGIGEDFVSKGFEELQFDKVLSLQPRFQANPLSSYNYFDTNGHGTHVAGTIAASLDGKGVAGVAPNAKINMGRVCGKFGCSDVAIVKAINWAVKNNTDIISMSLGGPAGSKAQKEALAAAEKAGVVNIAASGNSGTPTVSFPAAFESVISVGAIDSSFTKAGFSQWGPELDVVAPGVDVLSTVPQGSGRESLVQIGTSAPKTLPSTSFVGAAESFAGVSGEIVTAGLGRPEDFTGNKVYEDKIVLIKRGEIPFADKVKNAIKAKAKAVLIFNNAPGLMSGALTQDGSTLPISAAMIEQKAGEDLAAAADLGNKVVATIKILKTDYAAFQGTSMATPHVAGVAALVLAANPSLTTKTMREVLKSTAYTIATCKNTENQCGAGGVDAAAAVKKAKALRQKARDTRERSEPPFWGIN